MIALAACTDVPGDTELPLRAPGTLHADVVITSEDDARQLDGVTRINGSLTIDAPDVLTVELDALERVDGDFDCRQIGSGVAAPNLIAVGGRLRSECRAIELPALRMVGGDLWLFIDFMGPRHLALPALAVVDGGLLLHGKTTLDAPQLARVAYLRATAQGEGDHNAIATIDLPGLTVIDTDLSVSRSDIRTLRLPALRHVERLEVYQNPSLCRSIVEELVLRTGAQLTASSLNKDC